MKFAKQKSKRMPVRLRHKIEKAGAAKHRKQRKLAKKSVTWRSRIKKDPGIPNSLPFKGQIIEEIRQKRQLNQGEKLPVENLILSTSSQTDGAVNPMISSTSPFLLEESDKEFQGVDEDKNKVSADELDNLSDSVMCDGSDDATNSEIISQHPLAALLSSATARAKEYNRLHGQTDDEMSEDSNCSSMEEERDENTWRSKCIQSKESKPLDRRGLDSLAYQVIERADIILYILDARNPEHTRSRDIERRIHMAGENSKHLIFLVNKIDLVPSNVLTGWLKYLERTFPALPLLASRSAPTGAKTFHHSGLTPHSTAERIFNSLKAYAHNKQLKRSLNVGVLGYPNVGKSSLINLLTRRLGRTTCACPVGAEAGVTTAIRSVKLDKSLTLIDSPGVIFGIPSLNESDESVRHAQLVLMGALPCNEIKDPLPAVELLLSQLTKSPDLLKDLFSLYAVPPIYTMDNSAEDTALPDANNFLIHVARSRGRLGRGGRPNLYSAAMVVLNDWRSGRIHGWLNPPVSLNNCTIALPLPT